MAKGISAYSKPSADGKGVSIDVEAMAVDLITVFKASGHQKDDFIAFISETFDQVKVEVNIPKSSKN